MVCIATIIFFTLTFVASVEARLATVGHMSAESAARIGAATTSARTAVTERTNSAERIVSKRRAHSDEYALIASVIGWMAWPRLVQA